MTRHLTAVAIGTVWAVCLAAQGRPLRQASQTPPATRDLTVTGCVQEGTDAGVYILTNASALGEPKDMPRTFRLVSGVEDLDFTLQANHQVTAFGVAELKPPPDAPPGGRIDPRDLPAFTVKSIQAVAERCLVAQER